jgi:hypothetical protein
MSSNLPGSFEDSDHDALLAQFMGAHNVDSDEVSLPAKLLSCIRLKFNTISAVPWITTPPLRG